MEKEKAKHLSREEEYGQLIGPVRKLSKFIAIWPVEMSDVDNDPIRFRTAQKLQNFHGVFITIYMSLMTASQIADSIRCWGKFEEFTQCCVSASSCMLTVYRMIFYLTQRDKIAILLETMRNDWLTMSDEDKAIIRNKTEPAYIMSKWFITCISVTIVFLLIFPIIRRLLLGYDEYSLPYGGYFGFELKPPVYQILYAIEVLGGVYGVSNVSSVNCFNFVFIIHGAAKFLVLQNHITALRSEDHRSDELLRLYVQEHQRVIKYADILEEVINKVALGQFIASTGLVCFCGLQISEMMDNKLHLIQYAVYLTSAIFELFLFSYSGYQLTLESESIGQAAFDSGWIGSSFTQTLHIVMMRAKKPSKITAAKFYDMSLESFAAVLSTSFSYFTTLRAMNEE